MKKVHGFRNVQPLHFYNKVNDNFTLNNRGGNEFLHLIIKGRIGKWILLKVDIYFGQTKIEM